MDNPLPLPCCLWMTPLYIFERFFVLYTFIIHRVRKYYLQGSLNYFNKYLAWYWTVQASNSITHNWWLVKLPFWYLYLKETSVSRYHWRRDKTCRLGRHIQWFLILWKIARILFWSLSFSWFLRVWNTHSAIVGLLTLAIIELCM